MTSRLRAIVVVMLMSLGLLVVITPFAGAVPGKGHGHGKPTTTTTTTTIPTTTTTQPTTTTTRPTTTTTSTTTTTTSTTTTTTTIPQGGTLPPLPAGWPTTFSVGVSDGPGGAASMHLTAPYEFRYQYLAGGVQNSWANWNPNGSFVTNYVNESRAAGIIPVFSYYMIEQSTPGGGSNNGMTNLTNTSTMAAYYNDLKLFFQRAGAAGGTTVLHVEPDIWAFAQQRATGDNAATVPAKVGSSGQTDVAGLPDNLAGYAQAIVRLRNLYGPNVILGYHFSTWGTGSDLIYSDPSDATATAWGVRTANFEKSLGAKFDIAFTDLSDRDAAFKQYIYGDGGGSWYNSDDYRRSNLYINAFVKNTNLRVVLWQIPFGNNIMRAENNTWEHYQDNKVQWLFDRNNMGTYAQSGVVTTLYGRGADGPTCACDAAGDGITNPAAINGNNRLSLNADDDGGYFREQAALYYNVGKLTLPK